MSQNILKYPVGISIPKREKKCVFNQNVKDESKFKTGISPFCINCIPGFPDSRYSFVIKNSGKKEIPKNKLFKYLKPHKKFAIFTILLAAISNVMTLGFPLMMSMLINNGISAGDLSYIKNIGIVTFFMVTTLIY